MGGEEERYRIFFERNLAGVLLTTLDGRVVECNPAAARMFGFESAAELKRMPAEQFDPFGDARGELRRRLVAEGTLANMELRLGRRDGTPVWVMLSAAVLPGSGGDESLVESILLDITERKHAEERLQRLLDTVGHAAAEWTETFDAVDAVMMLLERTGRVRRLNRAAKDLAGGEYLDLLGRPVGSLGPGEPWQAIARLLEGARGARAPGVVEAYDAATGRTWEIGVTTSTRLGPERLVALARDVTATVKLQESLRRSNTMAAMGSLVAGVAHEVRNPLFSITATLDAFEARFGRQEEYQRYLEVLRGESQRLNDLMRDLLEYGRPAAALERAPGSVGTVLADALEACAPLARSGGVRIEESSAPDLPPVSMDPRRLSRVFRNLVENAIQHAPEGTAVRVESRTTYEDGRAWVDCAVSDEGAGFPPEDLPRIFEPFFSRRRGGTGLGLSIVQRVTEEHGGAASAANRLGGGAVLRVRLPALVDAKEEGSPTRPRPGPE